MGCDIHCYAEKRGEDGKWHFIGDTQRDEPEDEDDTGHISGGLFYSGRNYHLFSILADVRNGRGFAGVKTGEGYVPIAEPRGIPEDASETYREIVEQWDCDGHSHSHHTLRQLLDYDWTQTTKLQGWCNAVEWFKWSRWNRANGKGPSEYCGGVSGGNIRHVSAAEMDALLEPVSKKYGPEREEFATQHSNVYALAKWHEEYSTSAKEFLAVYVPRLLQMAGGTQGLDDMRIVFFFDN